MAEERVGELSVELLELQLLVPLFRVVVEAVLGVGLDRLAEAEDEEAVDALAAELHMLSQGHEEVWVASLPEVTRLVEQHVASVPAASVAARSLLPLRRRLREAAAVGGAAAFAHVSEQLRQASAALGEDTEPVELLERPREALRSEPVAAADRIRWVSMLSLCARVSSGEVGEGARPRIVARRQVAVAHETTESMLGRLVLALVSLLPEHFGRVMQAADPWPARPSLAMGFNATDVDFEQQMQELLQERVARVTRLWRETTLVLPEADFMDLE